MNVNDAAMEAIRIYNMGISLAFYFALYPKGNKKRLITTLEGTKDKIDALLEQIKTECEE